MKFVQVPELREGACDGCVHDEFDTGGYTEACISFRGEEAASKMCRTGVWIKNTPVARRNHDLLLVTRRLTKE